jgi:hypothetical protein
LTGIPPHAKGLINLHALKVEQAQLAGTIYKKVMSGMTEYFEAWQIVGFSGMLATSTNRSHH